MNIEDIITLDDNKDYLILEKVELSGREYLYTVEVDKNDKPTTDYHFLELVHEADGDAVGEVLDKNIIEALTSLITVKYMNDSINTDGEQAA